jgi:hypothetical protein
VSVTLSLMQLELIRYGGHRTLWVDGVHDAESS